MSKKGPNTNDEIIILSQLQWDTENLKESLDKLYQFTLQKGESSEAWYWKNSRYKRGWAQFLRVFAILVTALGGIIPIITQIIVTADGKPIFSPAWASVVLALGATALGLDRFFGFSTGWIRFITTALNIQAWIAEFKYEWELARVGWKGTMPTYEQAEAMISKCSAFSLKISNAVQEETHSWVEEFQATLKTLDQDLKNQASTLQPGALVLNIKNGEQCEDGWTTQIDARSPEQHYGQSGVLSDLYPGLYQVKVSGKIDNKPVHAETAVRVNAGEIATVEITLS